MPFAKKKKNNKMKKRIAIYPGTFDPITNGHISLIQRTCGIFDSIIVAVAKNAGKSPMFGHAERFHLVKKSTAQFDKVEVIKFDCLLANLARKMGACSIVRGLRAVSDFEYEFQMALMNRRLAHEIETVFLMPSLSWVYLSSTIVKDVATNKGEVDGLVPPAVARAIAKKLTLRKKKK